MDIYKFQTDVHKNACEHGWWEEERTPEEIYALIHSEWSEALEEYRVGRPMVWHGCADLEEALFEGCGKNKICTMVFPCAYREQKPEGIAVELIDGCIRILDYLGKLDVKLERTETIEQLEHGAPDMDYINMPLPTMVSYLHFTTSRAMQALAENDGESNRDEVAHLYAAAAMVCAWVKAQGFDPEAILMAKHLYNLTRPYKHGGKVI